MDVYFYLNNNEKSRELLVNKFNVILEVNQSRLMTKKSVFQTNHRNLLGFFRSIHRRCSAKEGVPKKFAIFTTKYLCWSPFLIKLQAGLQLY